MGPGSVGGSVEVLDFMYMGFIRNQICMRYRISDIRYQISDTDTYQISDVTVQSRHVPHWTHWTEVPTNPDGDNGER